MENRDFTEHLMRQLGLAARGSAQGITALPAMLWNGPVGVANWAAGANIPRADIGPVLDALGLPRPTNAVEGVAQNIVEAMGGVGARLYWPEAGHKLFQVLSIRRFLLCLAKDCGQILPLLPPVQGRHGLREKMKWGQRSKYWRALWVVLFLALPVRQAR